jgi:hypothetical protein
MRLNVIAVLLLAAPAALAQAEAGPALGAAAPAPASFDVKMIDVNNKPVGTAKLTQTAHGVLISVDLHHLKPGVHAIHIHETAKCEPPNFKSTGGQQLAADLAYKRRRQREGLDPMPGDPRLTVFEARLRSGLFIQGTDARAARPFHQPWSPQPYVLGRVEERLRK